MPVKPLVALLTSKNEPPVPVFDGEKLHMPVPMAGTVAPNVVVVPQTVWLLPATEALGVGSNRITTSSVTGGHTPLLTVHLNTYVCPAVPVKPLVLEPVAVMLPPVPVFSGEKLQTPVPVNGLMAAKFVELPHTCWSVPALAALGLASNCIVTSENTDAHTPLLTVHLNT